MPSAVKIDKDTLFASTRVDHDGSPLHGDRFETKKPLHLRRLFGSCGVELIFHPVSAAIGSIIL